MRVSPSGGDLTPAPPPEPPSDELTTPSNPSLPAGQTVSYPRPSFWYRLRQRETLRAAILTLFVLVLIGGVCGYHFTRNYVPGILSPEAMDNVQAVREFARNRKISTLAVYPLLTSFSLPNPDGTMPDMAHPILYTVLAGTLLRLQGIAGPSAGDREATLLTLSFFVLSLGACWLLSHRLFGLRGALLSLLLYGMGGAALAQAITPQPLFLGVTLFTLLLIVLYSLDVIPSAGQPDRRPSLAWAVAAGALFGLLYLTLYSTLLLLPAILYHLWRGSRRRLLSMGVFLVVLLLVTGPVLLRTFRMTRNPVFNSRTLELVMYTETYPGTSLYRQAGLPQPIREYLAAGGAREVMTKAGRNLLGFYRDAPGVLGLFVLPLLLGASLTRFTDGRVNRLRGTVYLAVAVHVLGLSLFGPHTAYLPLLLLYAPFAAVLGASFLLSIVRARNLPVYFARATVLVWTLIACVPGLAILLATPTPAEDFSRVYEFLNERSPEIAALRTLPPERQGFIIADRPWEMAFRCDHPSVWMPADSGAFQAIEERSAHRIEGIVLTPELLTAFGGEKAAAPWVQTYDRIASLTKTIANLDGPTRQVVVDKIKLFYPDPLVSVLRSFRPRSPVPDRTEGELALIFWRVDTPGRPDATVTP
jgi:hypothetical protein